MTRPALTVGSPVAGTAVDLAGVTDEVFASGMVGPGLAIDPLGAEPLDGPLGGPVVVVAPVSGLISALHPHAFAVQVDDGRAVLVHLGLDTVQLRGAGFELLAAAGQRVAAGDPVVRWDPALVAAGGRSPVCPVVAIQADPEAVVLLVAPGDAVARGAAVLVWR